MPSQAERRPGRPRSQEVTHRVLGAAAEILSQEGMSGFSIEAVAQRSRTSKVTLYRWWASKGDLALDAFVQLVDEQVVLHASGDPEHDLLDYVTALVRQYREGPAGRLLAEIIGQTQLDAHMCDAFVAKFLAHRREKVRSLLTGLQASGRISPAADVEVLIDQIFGAIYHRLFFRHQPLDDALALALVANALAQPGAHGPR